MARDSQQHSVRGGRRLSDRVESISNQGNTNSNSSSFKSSFGGTVSGQRRESNSSEGDLKELKMQVMEFKERNRELSGITMEQDQVDLSLSQLFREQAALEHDRLPREVFIDQQPHIEPRKNPREIHLSPKPGAQQMDRDIGVVDPRSHLSNICAQRQRQRELHQQHVLESEAQAMSTSYAENQPYAFPRPPPPAQLPPQEDTPEYRAFLMREMQRLGMQPNNPEPLPRQSQHTADSGSAARSYYSPYRSHHTIAKVPSPPPRHVAPSAAARAPDFWDDQPRYEGSAHGWAPEPSPYSHRQHHGASYNEQAWDSHHHHNRMMVDHPPPPPPEERKPPSQKTIEIAPGITRSLRGAEETTIAIEAGWFVVVDCLACEANLQCIADCELVLCSACRTISPNHESSDVERHGVGLGLNVTGRKREIMTQQCS